MIRNWTFVWTLLYTILSTLFCLNVNIRKCLRMMSKTSSKPIIQNRKNQLIQPFKNGQIQRDSMQTFIVFKLAEFNRKSRIPKQQRFQEYYNILIPWCSTRYTAIANFYNQILSINSKSLYRVTHKGWDFREDCMYFRLHVL